MSCLNLNLLYPDMGRDGIVGIATHYELDVPGIIS